MRSRMTILFPFVAFMVASFDGVTEEMVGLYSGLVAASFAFGQYDGLFLFFFFFQTHNRAEQGVQLVRVGPYL